MDWENGRPIPQNLPIDRILSVRDTAEAFVYPKTFNSQTYFQYLLGTTKTEREAVTVVLHFTPERRKYVETKKIHPTQRTAQLPNGGLEVRLFVELNRELEARILEFGCDVTVIEPPLLRDRIKDNLRSALAKYE